MGQIPLKNADMLGQMTTHFTSTSGERYCERDREFVAKDMEIFIIIIVIY